MNFNIEDAEILVKNFNDHIKNELNNFLASGAFAEEEKIMPVETRVKNYISDWGKKQIAGLKNLTPEEYVEAYDDLDELIKLFDYFSNNSIEGIPDFFVEKVFSFGDDALNKLSEKLKLDVVSKNISDHNSLSEQDNYQINLIMGTLNAIIGLADKASSLCDNVIEFMASCHNNNDLFLELGSGALKNMGTDALMRVVDYVNNAEAITNREEYMLMALSDTGHINGNDDIYRCLKSSFRRMDNKLIGAVLLGDYGDGRAVPMLRKFAIDNKGLIDENVYFGVLGAIDKLGGEVKELLPSSIPSF